MYDAEYDAGVFLYFLLCSVSELYAITKIDSVLFRSLGVVISTEKCTVLSGPKLSNVVPRRAAEGHTAGLEAQRSGTGW